MIYFNFILYYKKCQAVIKTLTKILLIFIFYDKITRTFPNSANKNIQKYKKCIEIFVFFWYSII